MTEHYVAHQLQHLLALGYNSRDAQNAHICLTYVSSPPPVRDALNTVFIALCGHSLDDLITNYTTEELKLAEYDQYFDRCEKANKIPLCYDEWDDNITEKL